MRKVFVLALLLNSSLLRTKPFGLMLPKCDKSSTHRWATLLVWAIGAKKLAIRCAYIMLWLLRSGSLWTAHIEPLPCTKGSIKELLHCSVWYASDFSNYLLREVFKITARGKVVLRHRTRIGRQLDNDWQKIVVEIWLRWNLKIKTAP